MKKGILLPLFATMVLISQAWGAACLVDNTATKLGACEYSSPPPANCYELTTEYTAVTGLCKASTDTTTASASLPNCTCDQIIDACKKDGKLYSFASRPTMWASSPYGGGQACGSNGGTLEFSSGCDKWCKWSTTGCTEVKPDPTGTTPTTTCEEAIANCSTNGLLFDTQAACNAYVPSSSSTATSSSSGAGSSSSGNSSSSQGSEPIISYNKAPVTGLNVTHFGRNLQIASGKDANVALFDMRGKQVLSQKVLSGTTTISLQKQRQGIYYAVVKSESQKQTVKVVLK